MKITSKILSLPPYLSTSWYDVDSLFQSDDGVLVVALTNGTQVRLEHLTPEVVNAIFNAHACFLEEEAESEEEDEENASQRNEVEFTVQSPLTFGGGFDESGDAMKIFMEHDPSRSLGPLLPDALLQRISSLAKMFLPPDMIPLDASHANCRCPFCQIVRALTGIPQPIIEEDEEKKQNLTLQGEKKGLKETEKSGSPEKNKSSSKESDHGKAKGLAANSPWSIQQMDDQLYTVTEKAHPDHVYQVSLAAPITCSCGEPNCVHIIAVLKS